MPVFGGADEATCHGFLKAVARKLKGLIDRKERICKSEDFLRQAAETELKQLIQGAILFFTVGGWRLGADRSTAASLLASVLESHWQNGSLCNRKG